MVVSLVISSFLYQIVYPYKKTIIPAAKNQSLKIILSQSSEEKLTLKSLGVVSLPPSNYQLNLTHDFYKIMMVNEKGEELFSGKVINKDIIPPPDVFETGQTGNVSGIKVDLPSSITVYLPYYKNTKQILFQDDKGILKLQIDKQILE